VLCTLNNHSPLKQILTIELLVLVSKNLSLSDRSNLEKKIKDRLCFRFRCRKIYVGKINCFPQSADVSEKKEGTNRGIKSTLCRVADCDISFLLST